jgi:hypothetical protein
MRSLRSRADLLPRPLPPPAPGPSPAFRRYAKNTRASCRVCLGQASEPASGERDAPAASSVRFTKPPLHAARPECILDLQALPGAASRTPGAAKGDALARRRLREGGCVASLRAAAAALSGRRVPATPRGDRAGAHHRLPVAMETVSRPASGRYGCGQVPRLEDGPYSVREGARGAPN